MSIRLDNLLIEHGLVQSQKEAQAYILAGKVYINDKVSDKPGNLHSHEDIPEIRGVKKYVSRGAFKLLEAITTFTIPIEGKVCVDIGASTGGFTDCLLQHGAKHVYAVDVAYGQLSWKLRQDKRVTVIERFNARQISKDIIPQDVDLVTIDVSFISLTKLLPVLPALFETKEKICIITLIKPQFELPRDCIEKGGVVTKDTLHQQAINKVTSFALSTVNLTASGTTTSPILGPKGNKEFLALFTGK